MDAITHLLVGRLLAAGVGPEAAALGILATVFAVLPDVDTVTWAFPRLTRFLRHRGATHSLVFGVAASLVAATGFAVAGLAPFGLAFAVALAGFLSHVVLDVLNWGCLLLWPWSRERVEHTVHGGFTWSPVVSLAGLVVLEATAMGDPTLRGPVAAGLGALGVVYFASRVVSRALAARAHPGVRLLPTANPLVWALAGTEASRTRRRRS